MLPCIVVDYYLNSVTRVAGKAVLKQVLPVVSDKEWGGGGKYCA